MQLLNSIINVKALENHFFRLITFLIFLQIPLLSYGIYQIFYIAPDDYLHKELVKILYIHVPSAWLALMLYIMMASFGALFLIYKNPFYDIISTSFAGIGATFALLTLITGAIWGKPAWGTWWVWDARLTSMLILFFTYLIYILLRNSFEDHSIAAHACGVFSVLGAINIPIIKFSVNLWNTIHQGASVLKISGPSIHSSMLLPLLLMFSGLLLLSITMVIIEARTNIYLRKSNSLKAKVLSR